MKGPLVGYLLVLGVVMSVPLSVWLAWHAIADGFGGWPGIVEAMMAWGVTAAAVYALVFTLLERFRSRRGEPHRPDRN